MVSCTASSASNSDRASGSSTRSARPGTPSPAGPRRSAPTAARWLSSWADRRRDVRHRRPRRPAHRPTRACTRAGRQRGQSTGCRPSGTFSVGTPTCRRSCGTSMSSTSSARAAPSGSQPVLVRNLRVASSPSNAQATARVEAVLPPQVDGGGEQPAAVPAPAPARLHQQVGHRRHVRAERVGRLLRGQRLARRPGRRRRTPPDTIARPVRRRPAPGARPRAAPAPPRSTAGRATPRPGCRARAGAGSGGTRPARSRAGCVRSRRRPRDAPGGRTREPWDVKPTQGEGGGGGAGCRQDRPAGRRSWWCSPRRSPRFLAVAAVRHGFFDLQGLLRRADLLGARRRRALRLPQAQHPVRLHLPAVRRAGHAADGVPAAGTRRSW